ncbi:threonine--tRNA ligase 2, cytoplasmic isoform X3 [Desmodus rotundus]|uniref:threonine--tRNA ligase 2, cytoplasmic isoform X3 n=1 Tax=Desmodus rotundus TaxID=9430 RepID=UPI0039E24E3B
MATEALTAETVALRLQRQEDDITWLWKEVLRLREELVNAPYPYPAEGPCLTREVVQLRAENRDLRDRLYRLRVCLAEELSHQVKLERATRAAAAQEETRSAAAGAQPPSSQNQERDIGKKEEKELDCEVKNQPHFIKERLKLFEILKKDHQLFFAIHGKKGDTSNVITIRLADGKTVEGEVWKTTPYQVAADISPELAESTVVARVNGELWDLDRPLEGDSTLELLTFDDEEAQAYNKFKCRILDEKVNTPTTTIYRCGSLIDLCRGPHVRHTGKIKTIKIFKNSSTYWEGNPEMETLQRIYGISFPDHKRMKTWEKLQEEAKSRDHRKIGKDQELFFFHDLSPGSCFFLPRGAFIYNTLMDFIREEYHRRHFTEVLSPSVYNSKLWEASGHWQHYSANMFAFDVEKDTFALKPMNCPGHCLMFAHRPRSWREMPVRLADFGVLHRNELSGTLSGLTRVRRFQQDDAHIFCMVEQIEEEIKGCLQFLQSVYSTFGFSFQLNLSTRPEDFLGEMALWDEAEKQLQKSLMDFGKPWKVNPGDGAFYGPKIDIKIKDAIGRSHQCATIQLDFQLPIRFNLTYVSKEGDDKKNPVIIHRAILGSVERMIAILSENYGGKWPFWLSPRQVMVIPVGPTCEKYALQVSSAFFEEGFMADVDLDHSCTLNKKIRNAQLAQYNFILVVGEKEKANNAVNVRTRDNKIRGEISLTSAIDKLKNLKKSRTLNAEEEF